MKKLIAIVAISMLCSCSFSFEQGYQYSQTKKRFVKIKSCRHKIHNPNTEWRFGY